MPLKTKDQREADAAAMKERLTEGTIVKIELTDRGVAFECAPPSAGVGETHPLI